MKTAWNKGKKLTDYPKMGFQKGHSFFSGGEKGWFKKGQAGHTTPHSEISKEKNRIAHIGKGIGADNASWKGGVTPLLSKIKRLTEYKGFQEGVLRRDNFTCRKCVKRGGNLTAHHLTAFSFLIHVFKIRSVQDAKDCFLIWNIRNGVTLCEKCHAQTSNFGWRAVETPKDRVFYPKIIVVLFLCFLVFPTSSHALTFGNTVAGASSESIGGSVMKGTRDAPASSGTVTKISACITAGVGTNAKGVVVDGTALTILTNGITPQSSTGVVTKTFVDWTYVSSPSITASTNYYAIIIPAGANPSIFYDNTGGTSLIDGTNSEVTPTDPTDASILTTKYYSIYATYTAVAAATTQSSTATINTATTIVNNATMIIP